MVVGTPTDVMPADGGRDTLREIVLDVIGDRDFPVLAHVDFGISSVSVRDEVIDVRGVGFTKHNVFYATAAANLQVYLAAHPGFGDGELYRAAAAVSARSAEAPELVSVAKAYIGQYGAELTQDCVQIHGGIGVTFEHDLHLYVRRLTVNRALFGTPADHRQRIATLFAGEAA